MDLPAWRRALEIAKDIAKSAPLALRMAKAAINSGMDLDMSTALKLVGMGCSGLWLYVRIGHVRTSQWPLAGWTAVWRVCVSAPALW